MKIGCRNGSLGADWDAAFAIAKEIGFDGIELDVGAEFKDSFLWDANKRKKVVELQQTTGIELPAVCLGGMWTHSPASADQDVRKTAVEFVSDAVRFCKQVGARVILAPINDCRGEGWDVAMDRWIEVMEEVKPVAEEFEIVVALENCGCNASYMLGLIQALDSTYIQGYFDMANIKIVGDNPPDAVRLLGKAIAHVHAKDWKQIGDKRQGSRLGDGDIPVIECVKALKEVGYDDYLTLETPGSPDPKIEGAYNLGYLRALI